MGAGASSQPGIPGINVKISESVVDFGSESSNDPSTQGLTVPGAGGLGLPRKTNLSRHHSSRRRRDKDILRRDSSKRRSDKPITIQVKQGCPGIDISNSKLQNIAKELFQRPDIANVRWMDASYNELIEITGDIIKLVSLTSLNFDNNFISELSDALSTLCKLSKLILSNNRLKVFAPSILQLQSLTELSLSNNKLNELPDQIGDLCNLVCLYVSHNTLQSLPVSIGNLRKLRILDIRYNNIRTLPESIENMSALERLQAYCNELERLPEGIGSCSRLRVLRISSNRLSTLPVSLGNLVLLETLDVHNNKLSFLPDCVCELSGLSELHIGDNEISYLNDKISGMKKLQTLKVNSNGLQCLPTFLDSLTNLRYLHIRNNYIRTLPETMNNLQNLLVFDAKNNPIHFPPREVWERGLSAIKAYFEEIKRSGSSRSSRLKITVLGSEGAGKTSFIHGLTKSCVKEDLEPTAGIEVTRWIPVEDPNMAFILWDHSGNPLYDSTHQFFFSPGSLVFLVVNLHQYQYQNAESYQACVGKYVKTLRQFGGESVIQIVGTHGDLCNANDISNKCDEIIRNIQSDVNVITKDFDHRITKAREMVELFQRYQKSHNHSEVESYCAPSPLSPSATEDPVNDVVEYIKKVKVNQPKFLSNVPKVCGIGEMAGIKDFRRILFKLTQDKKRYPTVELFLPRSWLDLEAEVKTLKEGSLVPVIPLQNLIDIAQEKDPQFKDKDILEALLYLHMTGEVLHFVGIPGLKDYVFVSPTWLIDVIKCVISPALQNTLDTAPSSDSRMPREKMTSLWDDFNLAQDQYSLLQTLATAFGLWYPEQGGYVVPTLMKHVPPEAAVEKVVSLKGMTGVLGNEVQYHSLPSNEYQIIMKFLFPHYMPKGLFGRIAVKCRKHCGQYHYHSTTCLWAEKHGVSIVFLDVTNNSGGNCLTLCTRASKDKLLPLWRMLLAFLNEIEELLSQWQGLLFYRYLVCPHCFLANEEAPFHFLGEWYKANVNRLPEIVKIACPVARGAVRVHLKLLYPPKNAHVQPTQVSESEIQLVAGTVSEHWTLLANILGITEEEIANFSVSDPTDPESQLIAMLKYWVELRKEDATSEELQNALKILNKITSPSGEEDQTERTETIAATNKNELPTVAVNL